MDLYAFGFNGHSQFNNVVADSDIPPTTDIPAPTLVLHAENIKVLWLSWCDALIAYQSPGEEPALGYSGTGLTAAQSAYLTQSLGWDLVPNLARDTIGLSCFGSTLGDGLRGVVISSSATVVEAESTSKVILFATEQELEAGIPEVQTYDILGDGQILDMRITSNGNIHVAVRLRSTGVEWIVVIENIAELRQCLAADDGLSSRRYEGSIADFAPTQWCSNGTTSTVLDTNGTVHTFTSDPRYPKCLGRPFEPTHSFETLPYLSETSVSKIMSGGLMTAAVSTDGELFIWGQSCPGSDGELATLKLESNGPAIQDQEDQDEFVKKVFIKINDEEARIYDVAIGLGHIVVAADVYRNAGGANRKVFAAGEGDRGQLGIGRTKKFIDNFKEVAELRGKRVSQVACAGWSSLVVTSTED